MSLLTIIEGMQEIGRSEAEILAVVVAMEKKRLAKDAERKALYPPAIEWAAIRADVFARDGFRCTYCGQDDPAAGYCVDHIVPVSAGGGHDLDNLAAACLACNSSKRDREVTEWKRRRK